MSTSVANRLGVGWAPTPISAATRALSWANIDAGDRVIELGCGDGRVAIAASKLGAAAHCVDLDPERVAAARTAAKSAGASRSFEVGDVYDADLRNFTAAFFFLTPQMAARLRPQLERLPAGARVVSRSAQILGWPCGERLSAVQSDEESLLFFRWTLPVGVAAAGAPPVSDRAVVEHQLDCAADDAVRRTDEL